MATAAATEPTANGLKEVPESDAIPTSTDESDPSLPLPKASAPAATKKWPGWPGDCVFRLVVPVLKVGSIIGRKGELIKKICEETHARVRVLEGAIGTTDRIVLVAGKEDLESEMSPAMVAALRVFKRVVGLSEGEGDGTTSAFAGVCSIRLLVASTQAISLIGKQGSLIKSIQESSGASVRILTGDEVPFYASKDERIVDIQGEPLKVLKALEAVVGHLRKFLVDHSVLPLFEKSYSASVTQDHVAEKTQSLIHTTSQTGVSNDYPLSLKRDSLYMDHEPQLEPQIQHTGLSLYGQDPAITGLRSSGFGRTATALVTQITQTMQIPLLYAEDIIGIGGANIAYIRRSSGATLTVQESRSALDEITVEIKGTSSQVQTAQQLIQDFIAGHKEPITSTYGKIDTGLRSYSQLANPSSYPSSSLATQSLGGYGSSGIGGYGSYRL